MNVDPVTLPRMRVKYVLGLLGLYKMGDDPLTLPSAPPDSLLSCDVTQSVCMS